MHSMLTINLLPRRKTIRTALRKGVVFMLQLAILLNISMASALLSPLHSAAKADELEQPGEIEKGKGGTAEQPMGVLNLVFAVPDGKFSPSAWRAHVLNNGADIAQSPVLGSDAGTVLNIPVGTYSVFAEVVDSSASGPHGYTTAFSGDCSSTGTVSVGTDAPLSCTLTMQPTIVPDDAPLPTITLTHDLPASVTAGTTFVDTLTWAVPTGDTTNLILSETIPANTTFVAADCGTTTPVCTAAQSAGVVTWTLGDRPATATGTVTVTLKAASPIANGTVVSNIATAQTNETGLITATGTTTITSSSTLALALTGVPDPVEAGGNITYTLSWSVTGTSPVSNLMLINTLPPGVAFGNAPNNGTFAGTAITWNLGSHQPGDAGIVTVTGALSKSFVVGSVIINNATVTSTETQPVTASQKNTVKAAPVQTTTLTLNGSVNIPFANPGDTAVYTVTVTNTGTAAAQNVQLSSILPTGITLVDGTATVNAALGIIDAGAKKIVTISALVAKTVAAGTYANSLSTVADNATQVASTVPLEVRIPVVLAATVDEHSDMSLTTSTAKTEVHPGDTLKYTLQLHNTGTVALNNVRIQDMLPSGFSYADTGSSKRIWSIGTLAVNETRTFTYDVTVSNETTAGTYKNTAHATADGGLVADTSGTVTVSIVAVKGAQTTLPATGADRSITAWYILGTLLFLSGMWGIVVDRRRYVTTVPEQHTW